MKTGEWPKLKYDCPKSPGLFNENRDFSDDFFSGVFRNCLDKPLYGKEEVIQCL